MSLVPTSDKELLRTAVGAQAARTLTRHGVDLSELRQLAVSELVESYGLAPRAAEKTAAVAELARRMASRPIRRGAAFTSSRHVFEQFGPRMRDLRFEQFVTLLLDGKHRLMRELLVSQGTLTSSPVHPREVFGPAMRHGAAALVLVHNHPSGDPSPSADDIEITRRLNDVGDLVGIRILDHIVIGDGAYVSFADRGLLPR